MEWLDLVGVGSGIGGSSSSWVGALAVFDDGTGPALYTGGYFGLAGSIAARNIAKWNGTSWSSLGGGMFGVSPYVRALAVFDEGSGSGAALYVGGEFTSVSNGGIQGPFEATFGIAKWQGNVWSAVGGGVMTSPTTPSSVWSLAVLGDDSPGGTALVAGGMFTLAGGNHADRVAKWDGSSWSGLGSGVNNFVRALCVFDDGSTNAPVLYATGAFTTAGGVPASRIARWNGTSWLAVGNGIDTDGLAMAVFDDGSDPALYVGGYLGNADDISVNHVAKWDGSVWSSLGSGLNGPVHAATAFADGTGLAIYAGGEFTSVNGLDVNRVAKWNGRSWSALGAGVTGGNAFPYSVFAMTAFESPLSERPSLYVGGRFTHAGVLQVNHVAQWDGSGWFALDNGVSGGALVQVKALAVFDDGKGPALYVAGAFTLAGNVTVNHIAKWDGRAWSSLAGGVSGGVNDTTVYALAVFDDGTGPALYAGGNFTMAGGVPANFVAKWDGTSWSALGSGLSGNVYALRACQVSLSAPALYVGGYFSAAGGLPANSIARWNGSSWAPLGSGVQGGVNLEPLVDCLACFDSGTPNGRALYAGGHFLAAGGAGVKHIARWSGLSWSALGGEVTGDSYARVKVLLSMDNGLSIPPTLYVGGSFSASPGGDSYLAAWVECRVGDINGDGHVDVNDLLAVVSAWGPCPVGSSCDADLNGDAQVNVSDLLLVITYWS